MTKFLTFFSLLFIAVTSYSQVNLNSGLVAYYPFNGDANDASGNGNNPVFNNATLTSDNSGNANSAYHFNGTDTYMKIPNSPSLNMANQMSIALKVKPLGFYTGPCYNNMMIMKGDADYLPGIYFLRFSDVITGCINPTTTHEQFYAPDVVATSPIVQLDQWYNVVWTCDGTTVKIYVNCVLAGTAPAASNPFTSNYDLYIGKMNHPDFPYWLNGDLDDIRIYNRALNEQEVNALCATNTPEASCNTWLATPSTSSYVTVGDVDVTGNKLTVEAEFNRSSAFENSTNFGKLVSKHTDGSNVNYSLLPVQCEITTDVTGYIATPQVCIPDLDKTYHVAMVYDGTTLKFYRNGFLLSQTPCTGNLVNNNLLTTIGQVAGNGYPDLTQFKGYINEVRIWNVARTQAEIRANMNSSLPTPASQTGLLGYYTFDNLLNKQGNAAFNGTLNGSASINVTNPNCSLSTDSCPVAISNIINSYTPVLSLSVCDNKITVEDASAFNVGDTVLMIQMKGAVIDSTNTAAFGTLLNYNNTGNYEFNYVKSKSGNIVELRDTLTRQYDLPGGKVQLIRVPYYNSVTVTSPLSCLPWDGSKGGVLVFNVGGTIDMQSDIDVTGKGFKGGKGVNTNLNTTNCGQTDYYFSNTSVLAALKGESITEVQPDKASGRGAPANGGGGGQDHNSGAGGGSNGSAGGFGGYQWENCPNPPFDNRGIGGKALVYSNAANKIFMGGGGGAGHTNNPPAGGFTGDGANGGGIIIIKARNIKSNGNLITANGADAISCTGTITYCHEAAGGGGGAGTILIDTITALDNVTIKLNGGKGGNMTGDFTTGASRLGPGGGGSGGVLWVAANALPANFSVAKNGGLNGVCTYSSNDPWGATAGQAGINIFNLKLPLDTVLFENNIDSVKIKDSLTSCSSYDFKGFAYTKGIPISSWKWNFGDAITAGTQKTSHTYIAPGTYNVTLIATNLNGCKDSVTIPLSPSVLNVTKSNDTSICQGSSTQLFVSGGSTYSWSPASTLDNANISNPVATPITSTIYYVTVTNSAGCSANDSIKITINNSPLITKSNDTAICINGSAHLSASGGSTYLWTPALTLDNPGITDPVAVPALTTIYYVVVTDSVGCSVTDSILVVVNNSPLITKSNDTAICKNSSVPLLVSGGSTYSWFPLSTLSDPNISNPIATPAISTTYFVTATNAIGCSTTDSIKITVNNSPVIIKSNDTAICNNSSAQLSVSGGSTYSWFPILTLSDPNISNPIATPSISTTYFVTAKNTVGCLITDSIKITINNSPVITKSNDTTICANSSIQLLVSGGVTYSWVPTSTLDNPNISNPIAKPINTTTYYVTVTNGNACSKTDSIKIINKPLPIISVSNDTSVCNNTPVQLVANGGLSYSWLPTSTLSNSNINNPVATPPSTTTYYVTVTDLAGCSNSDSIKIITSPIPVISKSSDTTICNNTSVQLFATGGSNYLWTPSSSLSNANISNPIATPTVTTKYFVTAMNNPGCFRKDSVRVSVFPKSIITISNDTLVCENTSTQIFATGGNLYTWSPAVSISDPNISNPFVFPSTTTTYFVSITDANSCKYSDSVVVTIKPAPVFTISPDQNVCSNAPAQLSASGGDSYFWQPINFLTNEKINNPIATPNASITYTVKIKDHSCNDSAVLFTRLNVMPLPLVKATKTNDIDCSSDFSQLNASGAYQYIWQPAASLSNNSIANPKATPNITTLYTVNGIDNNGCKNSDTVTVLVNFNNKNALYLMPNSFTPNADGVNDCYGLKYWGNIVELDFNIYNRFGEIVFHTTNPTICWDGKYKGEMQNPDVFVYTIKARTSCGTVNKKGTVVLIR